VVLLLLAVNIIAVADFFHTGLAAAFLYSTSTTSGAPRPPGSLETRCVMSKDQHILTGPLLRSIAVKAMDKICQDSGS
jgi:hypothetical protein